MKRIPFVTGQSYHLYNRGRSKLPIFHDAADYRFVLGKMKEVSCKYDLTIIAYCLLSNHYHLLVRQDGLPRAGLLPQRVFNSYAKAYNKKYDHSGTIFQGPFYAKPVPQDSYLMRLCAYIHANPVIHGLIRNLSDWEYSNYHEWIGARDGMMFDRDLVRKRFPCTGDYKEFVADYILEERSRKAWEEP